MSKEEFWNKSIQFCKNNELELCKEVNFQFPFVKKYEYYRKNVRTGGVFNGEDHFLFIDVPSSINLKKEDTEEIHEKFRTHINSKIKTPRFLRLKVPNILTVFVAEKMPDQPTIDYILKIKRPWQGGEVHNVVWISTNDLTLISHGNRIYTINGLFTLKLKNLDPSNRSLNHLKQMIRFVIDNNEINHIKNDKSISIYGR